MTPRICIFPENQLIFRDFACIEKGKEKEQEEGKCTGNLGATFVPAEINLRPNFGHFIQIHNGI